MNVEDREKIKKTIEDQIRNTKDGDIVELSKFWGFIENELEKIDSIKEKSKEQNEEEVKSLYDMVQKLRDIKKNSSYLDAFLPLFTNSAYNLPENYFENQNSSKIMVELQGDNRRYKMENSDFALKVCFPGSTTFRYGVPRKVRCGTFPLFQSDTRIHGISKEPIPGFSIDNSPVYSVDRIRTSVSRRHHLVCPICLAMQDFDENCQHKITKATVKKPPYSQAIIKNQELNRKTRDSIKNFRYPLNTIFSEIQFLDFLKIGIALTGFNRSWSGRTIVTRYSPYIGYLMETKGISFKIKQLDKETVSKILQEKQIVRDLIINKIAIYTYDNSRQFGIPTFHSDLFISAIIRAIRLDEIDNSFNAKSILDVLDTDDWIDDAKTFFDNESNLFGLREPYSEDLITDVFKSIQNQFSINDIEESIHEIYATSLAHALYLAGSTTSGSLYNDLSFKINSNENSEYEIILFDNAFGGNGSCELIYEYLFLPELDNDVLHRPRYMDETLMDYILPCTQGTVDRIFYQNMSNLNKEDSLVTRLELLEKIRHENPQEFEASTRFGIENMFPRSIGMRHFDTEDDEHVDPNIRTAEKIREISHICIHGCPDCISLGRNSLLGEYKERYTINKYLIDMVFEHKLSEISLKIPTTEEEVRNILNKKHLVRLVREISDENEDNSVENIITNLRGKKIDDKVIKFSGKWVNCPINKPKLIEMSYLLSLT